MKHSSTLSLIVLAFIAFVALGLPDGLLGVGWPSIRNDFSLQLDAIGLFLSFAIAGYLISSFLGGFLLSRLGVGRILSISCVLTGLALLGYTFVPQWWMVIALGLFAGLGAGAIDAGINTYAATHFSERLMQWLHASWGVGITLGPVIMTLGLTSFGTWRFGYRIVGGFQLALAAGFALTLKMWSNNDKAAGNRAEIKSISYPTPLLDALRQSQVWLSAILFFLYVGAESGLGTWTYTLLTESRGVDKTLAGFFAGSYWFTFTIGRILAGMMVARTGANRLVFGGLVGALCGAGLLIWNPCEIANVLSVSLIGLFIAPIFPAMMSATRTRVGDRYAANTIGIQMAATGLGAAIIPSLFGVMARRFSLEIVPVCLTVVIILLLCSYVLALRP